MLYLDNELLGSERIISFLLKNHDKLLIPREGGRPSGLEQFQRKLRELFFDKTKSTPGVLACLDLDPRFSSYPKLKKIINLLLSLEHPDQLEMAMTQIKTIKSQDWVFEQEGFDDYNHHFGYFPDASEELRELFQNLTQACRIQLIFKEGNHIEADNCAYSFAYKLLALYVADDGVIPTKLYQWIHELMQSAEGDITHPLHEIFVVKLDSFPLASKILDRENWRKFIVKEKIKALPYLAQAEHIEAHNDSKAPKTIKEAKTARMKFRYTRFGEDPQFAELCHQYNVSQKTFNACLDFISSGWPKKIKDNIPDLLIKGQDAAEGLFWVKLPIQDKRSLILGEITDCCQSLLGHSERCVIDAVTLSSNGLYVLLKQKKPGNHPVIIDGQINETNFKIVGQSYAWRSIFNNLCLDSLECLNGEVSMEAQRSILSTFANHVISTHPDIRYVTLGRGGKTPEHLFSTTNLAEHMKQGYAYGDARLQYLIAKISLDPIPAHEKFKEIFHKASAEVIDYFCAHTIPGRDILFEQLNEILSETSSTFIEKMKAFPDHNSLIELLLTLYVDKLLSIQNLSLIIHHPRQDNLSNLHSIFLSIRNTMISPQQAWMAIINCANNITQRASVGIQYLKHANILNLSNLEQLLKNSNYQMETALRLLWRAGILTQENFNLFFQQKGSPSSVASILSNLKYSQLLTKKNRATFLKHPLLNPLADIILNLKINNLLTQENFNVVVAHDRTIILNYVIQRLNSADILTQENFDNLMLPNHDSFLVTDEAKSHVWSKISDDLLLPIYFNRLLKATEHQYPMAELKRVTNQIIDTQHDPFFNSPQMTHTLSVLPSVSASATKLLEVYGKDLNLFTTIREIKSLVHRLPKTPKKHSAKRCISRITAINYTFIDEGSGISIRELLALVYQAMHDKSKRSGHLEYAKALFVRRLYEIQRGDNINAQGMDQRGGDIPMNPARTFNKLMEILHGIHADVEVYHITHEGACSMFPKLVEMHALNYLKTLSSPETVLDYQKFKHLMDRIKIAGSISPIWDEIKETVQTALWAEFKKVYNNNSNHYQFLALMNSGQNACISNFKQIKKQLLTSAYQPFLDEHVSLILNQQSLMLSLHQQSFWDTRHQSPEARESFDKQYGLTIP